MKLSYSLLAIQLAAVQTVSAFTLQQSQPIVSSFASTSTKLYGSPDPLVAAYQKKSAVEVDFSLSSPSPIEVPTPPPIVPEPVAVPEPSESLVNAVTQAANTAIDAAQSATDAAASFTSSASDAATTAAATGTSALFTKTSVTKAAVTASASSTASSKAPTLLDFVKDYKYEDSSAAVTLDDTKEKLGVLKANLLGDTGAWKEASEKISTGLGGMTTATKSMAAKTAAAAGSASVAAGSQVGDMKLDNVNFDSETLTNLANNLHFDQYGPWYVSAGVILLTLNAKEQSIAATEQKFELELKEAQGKAEEAADAAGIAADGAKLAKELVANMPAQSNGSNGYDILEDSRVKQLEVEKEFMQKEIQSLKAEVQSFRNILAEFESRSEDAVESAEIEIEIPIVKETMERDPDEEAKILSVLKEIDEANLAAKKKKTVTKRKIATKKKTAKAKNVTAKEKTVTAKAKTATKKKTVTKKKAVTKKKKQTVVAKEAVDDVLVVEEIAAAIKKEQEEKVEEKIVAVASTGNPWGILKESTLKRKTIAQLKAYLQEREVDVSGFSKSDLVGAVQSL